MPGRIYVVSLFLVLLFVLPARAARIVLQTRTTPMSIDLPDNWQPNPAMLQTLMTSRPPQIIAAQLLTSTDPDDHGSNILITLADDPGLSIARLKQVTEQGLDDLIAKDNTKSGRVTLNPAGDRIIVDFRSSQPARHSHKIILRAGGGIWAFEMISSEADSARLASVLETVVATLTAESAPAANTTASPIPSPEEQAVKTNRTFGFDWCCCTSATCIIVIPVYIYLTRRKIKVPPIQPPRQPGQGP